MEKAKFAIKISFEQAKFAIKKEFSPIILEKRVFFENAIFLGETQKFGGLKVSQEKNNFW